MKKWPKLKWVISLVLVFWLAGNTLSSPAALAATPAISVSPFTGPPGRTVTVSGTDFAVNETGITVTYEGATVASSITANSLGAWNTTFQVPASPFGPHIIDASGSVTLTANVTDVVFNVTPIITVNRTSGGAGTSLSVSGAGFAASETGITVTYDGAAIAPAVTANSQGSWSTTFVVPASSSGQHTIDASGSSTPVSIVPDLTFTVSPTLTVNRANGTVGSQVTVTGSGFGGGETGITITYGGVAVAQGITANSQGSWTANFVVPPSATGSHTIDASGASTSATSISDVTFVVAPAISASRTSGTVGNSVTVAGSGFGAGETGIMVTYDGTPVAQGITANSQGSWSATFVVLASASGSHSIDAGGASTSAVSVSEIVFTTSSSISVNRSSGATGSSISVTGSGFGAGETGITVTYDGAPVAQGITANSQGGWTATFVVPSSTSGSHSLGAFGSITKTTTATEASFNIGAAISLEPAFGHVGETVRISGSGFAANSPLRFTYDGKEIPAEQASTDESGSLDKLVTIPRSQAGTHSIELTDGQRNSSKATFTIENTPPPTPTPISPRDGYRLGLMGNAKPTLKWSSVNDPSGVTYILQIDTDPDFSHPILEKQEIPGSRYILTTAEALPRGEYYWRVRAVDGASNPSNWSRVWLLRSGIIGGWTIAIATIVLAALAAGVYFFMVRRRKLAEEAFPVPEVPVPQVFSRRWQLSAPAPTTRETTSPGRLALPQPARKGKTLSTEEMAQLKVLMDFAQSMPLAQPEYSAGWLVDLLEGNIGLEVSTPLLGQLLKGELQVRYEPTWMRHPTYQDLITLLHGQSIVQELDTFVHGVNQCASEAGALLQSIYRDAAAEIPPDFLERGGWNFIGAVYSDALSWFLGKSLRDPSERDYKIKPCLDVTGGTNALCLWGEEPTAFPESLIQASEEREALEFRSLHLRLRRAYRNDDRARQLVAIMAQTEVQRTRLTNAFSQFGRFNQ
ncbi:MAG: IPT/TIG domain-containing protein [Chloroflexi bacterium]|nr:IPT/TIG domain-containing protein [Chloroflexota bacterium]